MSNAAWTHLDECEVSHFDDRRSIDLIGTDAISTTSGFNLGVAYYTAEEFGEPQVHDDQEALYVVSGEGELRVGDEIVALRPGTAVYIPPGTAHGGRCTTDEPVMVIYAHGAV
ncbi:MAG: cupin domain-containing protein [Armatimonadota bacterium]|nr:cupin domain-containing protein [Armatimonadota bacterium]